MRIASFGIKSTDQERWMLKYRGRVTSAAQVRAYRGIIRGALMLAIAQVKVSS